MNIRNKYPVVLMVCFMLIFFSCSKNNSANSNTKTTVFGNAFTYTVTDTSGFRRTFSDTTQLIINTANGDTAYLVNGVELIGTAAYIIGLNTTGSDRIKFFFNDISSLRLSEVNQLILFLPYYQNNLTIHDGVGNSKWIMPFSNGPGDFVYAYFLNESYYNEMSPIKIDSAAVTTSITDSAGGYISGSFTISATTYSSKNMQVTGSFSHVSGNMHH